MYVYVYMYILSNDTAKATQMLRRMALRAPQVAKAVAGFQHPEHLQ